MTHYGPQFNGQSLGCGTGKYSSEDGGIVAVGPERHSQWPCGTVLRICGPAGCLIGERQDGCPGCGAYHVDVSEEGLYLVCGPGSGVCRASIEAFAPGCTLPQGTRVSEVAGVQTNRQLTLITKLAEIALADRTADLLSLSAGRQAATAGLCTATAR